MQKESRNKASVSSSYLASQRLWNKGKKPRWPANIIITGTKFSNGIGAMITERLRWEGCNVLENNLDVTDPYVEWQFDGKDTLIMCHGATHLDWFEEAPLDKLFNVIDVNLKGTVSLLRSFTAQTISKPYRKKVIAIGSMAHSRVLNGSAVYCAAKAGLAHLMRCLAWELAPKGFDLYTIHPSNVAGTKMSQDTIVGLMRYRQLSLEEATSYWDDSPIRDAVLSREEITELITFLLKEETGYLSGCQIELTGGQR